MSALDYVGSLTFRPNFGGFIIPLLEGSSLNYDPALLPYQTASNQAGSVNMTQQLVCPTILVRTHVYGSWFNPNELFRWFSRDTFGQLPNIGIVQWQYANTSPITFARCKVSRFQLSWGSIGAPLEALIEFRAYGFRRPPVAVRITRPYGVPYLSRNVTYGPRQNLETSVFSGSLAIDNNLVPNRATPHLLSIDGMRYPNDLYCDIYSVALELSQYTGGWIVDPQDASVETKYTLTFNSPGNGPNIRAIMNTTSPMRTDRVRIQGGAVQTRTYGTIRYDQRASVPILQFRGV
jgi:hypothetical protein